MISAKLFKKMHHFDLDLNFSINKEVLVIQGHSGSGKTTLLNCICGIKSPDEGEISLNEKAIFSTRNGVNIKIKDRNISYVFQNYALFPHLTVKENIFFGVKDKNIKNSDYVNHIVKVFKIEHILNRYPNQISGGEKQRTALARALATKPELLLLDEPFSALDSNTKNIVYDEFLQLKKLWNIDIILVTHNENEATLLGDKVLTICDGKIQCASTLPNKYIISPS
jgi:molybdate transport system ATP-binding protein